MLAKQANKIIPCWKEGVWVNTKEKRSSFLPLQWLTENKGYQGWHFFKLCNLCNCSLQLPCQINNDGRKSWSLPLENRQTCTCRVWAELQDFIPYPSWSSLQLCLRSLSLIRRNLFPLFGGAVWFLWWFSNLCLSLSAATPAAVHTACLPPERNACIACKLCCIHLALAALTRALSISSHEISVLVLASVWLLVILFCSLAFFLLYSLGKSAWVWNQLCLLLWGPWWR